jgi:hypothetical protein
MKPRRHVRARHIHTHTSTHVQAVRKAGSARIDDVATLSNNMSTIVALTYHLLAALPRPMVSKDFVAQITSPQVTPVLPVSPAR